MEIRGASGFYSRLGGALTAAPALPACPPSLGTAADWPPSPDSGRSRGPIAVIWGELKTVLKTAFYDCAGGGGGAWNARRGRSRPRRGGLVAACGLPGQLGWDRHGLGSIADPSPRPELGLLCVDLTLRDVRPLRPGSSLPGGFSCIVMSAML